MEKSHRAQALPRTLDPDAQAVHPCLPGYGGTRCHPGRCGVAGSARSFPRRALRLDRLGVEGRPRPAGAHDAVRCSQGALGKRIRAVCSPTFDLRKALRVAVRAVRLWPRGQLELSYRFRRDISDQVKWCLLEDVGGGDVAGVDFQKYIPVHADSASDRRIGRELRGYLQRNSRGWLRRVTGIVVDRGVIAIATEFRRDRRGKRIAREICALIQGADVADFTPGHTIFGHEDVVIRVCPARRE